MKIGILSVLVALSGLTSASSARAFNLPSEYFYGTAFLTANSDCAKLGIVKGTSLSLAAEDSYFEIDQIQSGTFTPILSFSIPSQGNYVLENAPGFVISNEFKTKEIDVTRDDSTGDIIIAQKDAATCVLNAVKFGE